MIYKDGLLRNKRSIITISEDYVRSSKVHKEAYRQGYTDKEAGLGSPLRALARKLPKRTSMDNMRRLYNVNEGVDNMAGNMMRNKDAIPPVYRDSGSMKIPQRRAMGKKMRKSYGTHYDDIAHAANHPRSADDIMRPHGDTPEYLPQWNAQVEIARANAFNDPKLRMYDLLHKFRRPMEGAADKLDRFGNAVVGGIKKNPTATAFTTAAGAGAGTGHAIANHMQEEYDKRNKSPLMNILRRFTG
jgi:hypothetical protein